MQPKPYRKGTKDETEELLREFERSKKKKMKEIEARTTGRSTVENLKQRGKDIDRAINAQVKKRKSY